EDAAQGGASCRFNFFIKELTPGGEPHGVSSFQFPIMIIVRSYCAARFPKSSRMPAQTRAALSRPLLYTDFAALQADLVFFSRKGNIEMS
ncbi:MAG: hypothetical protein IKP58_06525, partial [Victivallales bacterium]|nr:hypothetical protein [Victivallales bacterium]